MIKQSIGYLLVAICLHTHAQTNSPDSAFVAQTDQALAYIQKLQDDQNIPAISIAVGLNGRVAWSTALGYADKESQTKATDSTRFRAGSIGKTMTALALGVLYDQGKINFSDTIGNYLPVFKKKEYPITIRQVAGHQGGIRHYRGAEFFSNTSYASVEEAMEIFQDDKLIFIPGTQYAYSTYGYVLLGRVIERAGNTPYLDFMQQEVFDPLGMRNTVAEDAGLDETNTATYYAKNGVREAKEVNMSNKWAGGGFLSTPSDLVNMVNRATKVVSLQTLYQLITPQTLADGGNTGYGMGWRISKVASTGKQLVHHGGRSVGARSFLLAIPENRIVVAICTNTEADFGVQEAYDIAKIFMEDQ